MKYRPKITVLRGIALSLWASAACFAALSALPVSSAQAAQIHPLLGLQTLPENESASGISVNQTTHNFYSTLYNRVSNARHAYNFQASGSIDPSHPELIAPAGFGPYKTAVDNSGGPYDGYIYASNAGREIQQFDPTGLTTAVNITPAAIPPNGTPQGGGLPPVVNHGIENFRFGPIAVSTTGNIFVEENGSPSIDEFSPAGVFVAQLAAGNEILEASTGIALDAAGDIYLAGAGDASGLFELNPMGACVQAGCAPIDPAPIADVAIDYSTGQIFTVGNGTISEHEADGTLLGVTRPTDLGDSNGIGIDESTGNVIVASGESIQIYGPLQIVPDVETVTPESISGNSAILRGTIGAAGVAGATCLFQYVDAEEFAAHGFEGAAEQGCDPAGPFSGEATNSVDAHVEGLRGGTIYHERIVGTNTNGSNPGEDVPFTTEGPTVTEAISGAEETGITLEGSVDPRGSSTTYSFEYLTQAAYESVGWAAATQVPVAGENSGAGETPIEVRQALEGLAPGTAYRFRIVAAGTGGPHPGVTEGRGTPFSTFGFPIAGLPDQRGYEQASPTDKNGGNVQGNIGAIESSVDGDRITFSSNGGIPGGEGAQVFPTYLASRAADGSGWSTQGLLPPASYGQQANVLGWNEGLTQTYGSALKTGGEQRLLVRSSTSGTLTQIGPIAPSSTDFSYAGSSDDGTIAVLESDNGGLVPGDLVGKHNVYAYDRVTGDVVLAGVLGEGAVPAGGALGGPYKWFESPNLAVGGAKEKYYTQATHAVSADGSRIFFTVAGTGRLYVRINPFGEPAQLTPAQCRAPGNRSACTVTVSGPEEGVADPGTPAAFLGASATGRLVYFLDKGKLTDDSTAGAGYDLYRYDVDTGELVDLTADPDDQQGARVAGALAIGGPTGEDVFFVASGKLAPGATQAPSGETNLYGLHGTTIEFVARLGTGRPGGSTEDALAWTPTAEAASGELIPHSSRLSADGGALLFRSQRQLTTYDNHGVAELYLYRVAQGISCVTCNPTGEAPAGPASFQAIQPTGFASPRPYSFPTRNLSADGNRVFFDSADRLVASDDNAVNDVYEWEAPDAGEEHDSCSIGSTAYVPSSGGCLFLISGGVAGAGPSYFGDASESGDDVFFFTAQPLVAQDRDELIDVYDARVDGGIPSQNVTPPAPCQGEACRGSSSLAAAPGSPGTSSFGGPGNEKPPRLCRHGTVRRHGRCVAKHDTQHHKKHKPKHRQRKHSKRHARRHKGGNSG